MFTAQVISKGINKETARLLVRVEFTDGVEVIKKEFSFYLEVTLEEIKKAIKTYLDELNASVVDVPIGTIDLTLSPEVTPEPTVEELEKTAWDNDRNKLRQLQELVTMGVFTGSETQIVNLRAKVKADFKTSFL